MRIGTSEVVDDHVRSAGCDQRQNPSEPRPLEINLDVPIQVADVSEQSPIIARSEIRKRGGTEVVEADADDTAPRVSRELRAIDLRIDDDRSAQSSAAACQRIEQ